MGKTAAELRDEIAEQREEIGRDVDALGDRVIPSRIVERRADALRGRMQQARRSVMGDPDDPDRSSISGRAGEVKERVGDIAQNTINEVAGVPDRLRSGTEGNPLAAGLIAFGAGLLAATLLPTSRREDDLARRAQPQVENVGRQVGELGRQIADDLQPEVRGAVSDVVEEASDAGRRLADDAKDAVKETAQAARG